MDTVASAAEMIRQVEVYFDAADRCDVQATLATMTPDCVVEYLTDGVRFAGRDTEVKEYYAARARKVKASWHGNFTHAADPASGRVATRFDVRRTDHGEAERSGDNIDLFQFEGRLIKRITVWKSAGIQSR